MNSHTEEILRRLEDEAAKQEAERAKVAREAATAIERSDAELGAAKAAMRMPGARANGGRANKW